MIFIDIFSINLMIGTSQIRFKSVIFPNKNKRYENIAHFYRYSSNAYRSITIITIIFVALIGTCIFEMMISTVHNKEYR